MTSGSPGPGTSVVVVNWNGGTLLQDCLRSLADDAADRFGSAVEVVLVDNASEDGSVEQAEGTFPGLRVVRLPTNGGFAAGANAGIRAGAGQFIVLVNNDARVAPGFLDAIVAPMTGADGADVAAVTGRVLLADRYQAAPPGSPPDAGLLGHDGRRWLPATAGVRLVNSTGNVMTRSGNGRDRDWLTPADEVRSASEVFGFNGGCAALRRSALEEVGLLDERLFMYYEDTELSWRLRRAGWRILHAPAACTDHQHAASSGTATAFFQIHNTRNRLIVTAMHAPWPVFLRAVARTAWRLAAGPHRDRTARALLQALRLLPAAVVTRRATDRTARTSRRDVARWLVPD